MTTNNSINSNHNGVSGSGKFVGDTNATLVTPVLGTPSSGTLTNCTGLPLSGGITGILLAASLLPFGSNNTKIINFTHDISIAGNQTVTGVGFTPSLVIFFSSNSGATISTSVGFDNGTTAGCVYLTSVGTSFTNTASITDQPSGTTAATATITSFNSDGFVLNWVKTSTPTGTANIVALCFQ